jgi:hypothetical protein
MIPYSCVVKKSSSSSSQQQVHTSVIYDKNLFQIELVLTDAFPPLRSVRITGLLYLYPITYWCTDFGSIICIRANTNTIQKVYVHKESYKIQNCTSDCCIFHSNFRILNVFDVVFVFYYFIINSTR